MWWVGYSYSFKHDLAAATLLKNENRSHESQNHAAFKLARSAYTGPVAMKDFKSLFCERFNCPASEFEQLTFTKCLPWHASFLAPVLQRFRPHLFEEDFKFIRYLGASTSMGEAIVDLLNFRDANAGSSKLFRSRFKIRASGLKAARLAQELFANQSPVSTGRKSSPGMSSPG